MCDEHQAKYPLKPLPPRPTLKLKKNISQRLVSQNQEPVVLRLPQNVQDDRVEAFSKIRTDEFYANLSNAITDAGHEVLFQI